jgi:hypothetical protein
MSFSLLRWIGLSLMGCLVFFTAGCGQSTSAGKSQIEPVVTTASRPLPAVVNGVPLLALAKHALGATEAYSVSNPMNVRAVVSTQAALYEQFPAAGGTPGPEYVVVLQGHFSCGACGTAVAATSTTTTNPSTVPVTTMVLELPVPISEATNGVAVGVGTPDLSKLGHAYDLDPYIKSLAGVSVPIGPLPG